MHARFPLLAAALLAAAPAFAGGDPATNGALGTAANRIVGVWDNTAQVGPCGGPVVDVQHQTIVFQAGGTFLDSPRFPPDGLPNLMGIAGVHKRGIGVGRWRYDPSTDRYTLVQRFDWWVDNAYNGYQVVRRTMVLGHGGMRIDGPVRTTRYAADGTPLATLCGTAQGTRL